MPNNPVEATTSTTVSTATTTTTTITTAVAHPHHHNKMTKTSSPTPSALPAIHTTRAASNEYDTPAEAAAAPANTVPMMTTTTAAPAGGGKGGRMPVRSGRKAPNNTTSSSLHQDAAKNTTATNIFATTGAMANLVVSTAAPVLTSAGPAGIVTKKNGSGQNDGTHKKNKEATATSPSPSSSTPQPAATATTEASSPPSTDDPHEDACVLCCYPFPLSENESTYQSCCGEMICNGCVIAQKRTLIIGTNVMKPIANSKEEDLEFITITGSKQVMECPFCRKPYAITFKESLKRLWTRIDEYKDPNAMNGMGRFYLGGKCGLTRNAKKGEALFKRAYDLGDPSAANNLSLLYRDHVSDKARKIKYLEYLVEGARRGNTHCMINIGRYVAKSGNHEDAKRLDIEAARSGNEAAMNNIMENYRKAPVSLVSKEDLATTLRAFKVVNDTRKSESREYDIRHKAFNKEFQEKVRINDDYTLLQYCNSRRHPSENINGTDFWSLLRAPAKQNHGET